MIGSAHSLHSGMANAGVTRLHVCRSCSYRLLYSLHTGVTHCLHAGMAHAGVAHA